MSNIMCGYECGNEVEDLSCDACKAKERPKLRLSTMEPMKILGVCKSAAVKAGWSLERWVEFSTTARECLKPECEPAEMEKFLDVVRERFDVT